LLAAAGRSDEAAAELAALAEAAPRHAEVRFALAFVALARGEAAPAAAAAELARRLRTPYPEARLVHAEALARLGREREARQAFERFVDEAPERMAAERARVQTWLRNGNSAERIDTIWNSL
jgi:cellulose synthase operon protein C